MSELDRALRELLAHPGVEHVLVLGRDGLLIQHEAAQGVGTLDLDTVTAMVPNVMAACAALGEAAERGDFTTAAVEFAGGVALVTAVAFDVLLAVILRGDTGFAPLLRDLRVKKQELAAVV